MSTGFSHPRTIAVDNGPWNHHAWNRLLKTRGVEREGDVSEGTLRVLLNRAVSEKVAEHYARPEDTEPIDVRARRRGFPSH